MVDHPCGDGLTPACFKEYPQWAKKVLAYKLLLLLLPEELSKKLPGIILEAGLTPPPNWPPEIPTPPWVSFVPFKSALLQESGGGPPLYVQPWEPGPVHRTQGGIFEISIVATDIEVGEATASNWSDTRDSTAYASVYLTPGEETTPIYVNLLAGNYTIKRSIFKFSLADIPSGSTIISGYLSLKLYDGAGVSVCAQTGEGIFWENVADYLFFYGDPSSYQTLNVGENQFILSAYSRNDIQGKIGSDCFIFAREYDHDYSDVPPGDGELFSALVWKQNAPIEANRPTLVLTYR